MWQRTTVTYADSTQENPHIVIYGPTCIAGATGQQGERGPQGETGPQGDSMFESITVVQGPNGTIKEIIFVLKGGNTFTIPGASFN